MVQWLRLREHTVDAEVAPGGPIFMVSSTHTGEEISPGGPMFIVSHRDCGWIDDSGVVQCSWFRVQTMGGAMAPGGL